MKIGIYVYHVIIEDRDLRVSRYHWGWDQTDASYVVSLEVAYTVEFLEVGKNGSTYFPPFGVAQV